MSGGGAGGGWAALGGIADSALNLYAQERQWQNQKRALEKRHQWEVEDLKAAGLNPILSAHGGGPGASGGSFAGSRIEAGISSSAQNVLAKTRLQQELSNMAASERLTLATTAKTLEDARGASAAADKLEVEADLFRGMREDINSAVGLKNWFKREAPGWIDSMRQWWEGLPPNPLNLDASGVVDQVKGSAKKAYEWGKSLFKNDKD